MVQIKSFIFNPFQVNTYVLYDETGECVIIDAACQDQREQEILAETIKTEGLKPVRLLNTHCHVDHLLGNRFVAEKYNLSPECGSEDDFLIFQAADQGKMFGLEVDPPPAPGNHLKEGDKIRFGKSFLDVFAVPGHSPGSLAFYNEQEKICITGDALFKGSIGRTDLPGGNYETLISSITSKLMRLADDVKIYPGHQLPSTIGKERTSNPFLT
jgi:glyoxylase-like metal-dependent hydrolase (beta-lactamase superfamily II)